MIKQKEVFAREGDTFNLASKIGSKMPEDCNLDMKGADRPYHTDIATEIALEPGFGEWKPATATASIAETNKSDAQSLLLARTQEPILAHGVMWHGDEFAYQNMEKATNRNKRANYPPIKEKEWRMPDGSKRPTTVAELDDVIDAILERFEIANDSYNLWLDTDRQTPWAYP